MHLAQSKKLIATVIFYIYEIIYNKAEIFSIKICILSNFKSSVKPGSDLIKQRHPSERII